jgi:hypothetical protein
MTPQDEPRQITRAVVEQAIERLKTYQPPDGPIEIVSPQEYKRRQRQHWTDIARRTM